MATNKIEHQTNQVTINVNDSKVAVFSSDVAVGGVLSLNVQITDVETFFSSTEGTQNLDDLIAAALAQAEALAPKPVPPVDTPSQSEPPSDSSQSDSLADSSSTSESELASDSESV